MQYTDNTTMPPTDDDSITEDFKTFYPDKCASRTKLRGQNVKASSVEHFLNKLINFEWLTDYIPDKIRSLGNVDCLSLNWKTK